MFNLFGKKKIKDGASEFADQLDSIGYFSLLTDSKRDIKKLFIENCNSNSSFLPVLNEDIGDDIIISLDHRSYYAEAANLYELDFFKGFLDRIKPTFNSLNVPFIVTNYIGGWDSEKLEYNISVNINNKHYDILNNFHTGFLGYSVYKISEMINDVLKMNNSKNMVYLTGQGEIIVWHFLTSEQFECACNYYMKNENRPLRIQEWLEISEKSHMVYFKNQEQNRS